MLFNAAAAMTASGVPPIPSRTSTAGVGPCRGDRAVDVAVADQADPGAAGADLLDECRVAGPVEDHRRQIADTRPLGLGDPPQVLGGARRDVDRAGSVGSDRDLLHVERRTRIEHRATVADRDDRERVVGAVGGERRPVDRIDGDVDLGHRTVTDPLAVVQHRGFVLLALADHDDPVHLDRAQDRAHGVDGGPIGADLVASTDPSGGGQSGRFGDSDELHCKVAVGTLGGGATHVAHRTGPTRSSSAPRPDCTVSRVESLLASSSMPSRLTPKAIVTGDAAELFLPITGQHQLQFR